MGVVRGARRPPTTATACLFAKGGIPGLPVEDRRRTLDGRIDSNVRRLKYTGVVAAFGMVALVAACTSREEASSSPARTPTTLAAAPAPVAPATFVGVTACAGCHQQQETAWRGSHHDLAMQVADETTVLGDFGGATLTHFGLTSTFFRRDGKFFVRTDGPDGKLADYEVAYTFGVDPLQQYLVALPGGRWHALPIAWDTRPAAAGGQRWFHLNPDEPIPPGDLLHWTGIAENWNHQCAECHSTNIRKNYQAAEDRYETTWSAIDVACEACHGPGSNHVAWAHAGASKDSDSSMGLVVDVGDRDGARWLMDPTTGIARRSPARQSHVEVETCGRCHSRRGIVSEDYVWGRPLMDTHRVALLDAPLYHADGQIKDEVYEYGSFLQSRMYQAGVTCTNCHDAHSTRLRGVTTDVNAVCSQCHLPTVFSTPAHHHHREGSPGASCVACHMPAQRYMVIDPRRDHSIRVPRPDLTVKIGTPNACTGCHAKASAQWAADAAVRWWGTRRASTPHWGEAIHAGRENLPGADTALARLADDAAQPGIVRATAVSLLRPYLGPATAPSLERALHDGDPMVRAAAAGALDEADPRLRVRLAAPLLRDPVRVVRIDAARVLAPMPPDLLPAVDREAFDAALAEYRAAQVVNADRPEGHLNLAVLDAERGAPEAAEREYREAIRLAPALPSAYVNLADLYRAEGRDAEGEAVLRQGLEVAPRSGDLHHALGLVLVREQRLAEALDALARATQLDPEQARYAYVYAVALHGAGQTERALEVLRAVHRRHPGDRETLVALATMSRDRGDLRAAVAWARMLVAIAPEDAGAQRLLAELEARGG
jgi:predicted CXXCH cytochrome family protein